MDYFQAGTRAQRNNSVPVNKDVLEEIAKLKQQPGKNILIEGSAMLIQALLQADLIDEINLIVHPAVAGSGKRLFNDGMANTKVMKL